MLSPLPDPRIRWEVVTGMEGGKRNSIAPSQLAFGKIFNVNWSSEGRVRLYILRAPHLAVALEPNLDLACTQSRDTPW